MPSGNKFKGNDRRLLKKGKKVIQLIMDRDIFLAALPSTKRTSRISNRDRMFPAAPDALAADLTAVAAQIDAKLAETW